MAMPVAVPFFTSANAATFAKLSWEKRRARAKEALTKLPPLPEASEDALRVHAKLTRLNDMMDKAKDEDTWDKLSRSYERLFRCWQVLSRTPGPGQLKPEPKRQSRYWERPAPTPSYQAQPAPEPAANGNLSGDSIPPVKPQ